jgi:hypothetical protein
MRRRFERGLALVVGGIAAIAVFGPSLTASGQVPPPPTRPPDFTFPSLPSLPPPPTMPPFTRPTFTIPPPPTMPPPTMPPQMTTPPPTMPPPTRPSVTLPSVVDQAIQDVIDQLEQFGDVFADVIEDLEGLLAAF